jgi:ABC-type Fe3+ transport system substrate-binding protein
VDWVRLGKMLSIGQYLALSNKALRPNGGKAFIDFFLGDESMRILAKMVEADDFDAKGFAEKTQKYQKLFLR